MMIYVSLRTRFIKGRERVSLRLVIKQAPKTTKEVKTLHRKECEVHSTQLNKISCVDHRTTKMDCFELRGSLIAELSNIDRVLRRAFTTYKAVQGRRKSEEKSPDMSKHFAGIIYGNSCSDASRRESRMTGSMSC